MDKIRASAVYNRKGEICGVFLFNGGQCLKYILSEEKGGKGLLAELAPSIIGMPESVFNAIFNIFIRGMNWEFSGIYEYDLEGFRHTFNNIVGEINKSVNDTLPQEESQDRA